MKSIAEAFPNRVCGVLRTENADAGVPACLTAPDAGVGTIEVTKTVPPCFELIQGLIATTSWRYPGGVGTVWDPGAVRDGKDAGDSRLSSLGGSCTSWRGCSSRGSSADRQSQSTR